MSLLTTIVVILSIVYLDLLSHTVLRHIFSVSCQEHWLFSVFKSKSFFQSAFYKFNQLVIIFPFLRETLLRCLVTKRPSFHYFELTWFCSIFQENSEIQSSSTKELEATIQRLQAALDASNRLPPPVITLGVGLVQHVLGASKPWYTNCFLPYTLLYSLLHSRWIIWPFKNDLTFRNLPFRFLKTEMAR